MPGTGPHISGGGEYPGGGGGSSSSSLPPRSSQTTTFVLLGEPVPWSRVSFGPKGGRHSFVPRRVKLAEDAVAWAYRAAGGQLHFGPVALSLQFFLGAFGPTAKRHASFSHTDPRDLSNLVKLVEDGLRGLAYPDDRRIVLYDPPTGKWLDQSNPRTVVAVRAVDP